MPDFDIFPSIKEKEEEWIEEAQGFDKVFPFANEQFDHMRKELDKGKTIKELKELNKEIPYQRFREYFKKNKIYISDNLLKTDIDCQDKVAKYDWMIQKLKEFEFHKESDLRNFLKDVDYLFSEVELKKAS